jgi:hypothetical protein
MIPAIMVVIVSMAITLVYLGRQAVPDKVAFKVAGNSPAILRLLADTVQWRRMLQEAPAEVDLGSSQRWQLTARGLSDVSLRWQYQQYSVPSLLQVFASGADSALLLWNTQANLDSIFGFPLGLGARRMLVKDMQALVALLQSYTANPVHVYGFEPRLEKVQDTVFLSTTAWHAQYPDVPDIYALVGQLEAYAQQQGVATPRMPIYNVQQEEGSGPRRYRLMVALPIERVVRGTATIEIKRMILGNLLTATIEGQPSRLPALFEVFEEYRREHGFTSPAIPFMELTTDRRQQPDSSRWITRFCYPVF